MGKRINTSLPWSVNDMTNNRETGGYIGIEGPNGEKIASIFPSAGVGGVGATVARANAALIVEAVRAFLADE